MIQFVRCNNCYTIYEEEYDDYIVECEKCNSEEWLMDITEEEAQ